MELDSSLTRYLKWGIRRGPVAFGSLFIPPRQDGALFLAEEVCD
jgi:hypothetical protein